MKRYLLNFSLLALSVFCFASCAKTSTSGGGTVAPTYADCFTITGGPFKNTVVNFKNFNVAGGGASGYYDTATKITNITVTGSSGDSLVLGYYLTFDGTKTGAFALGTGNDFMQISTISAGNLSNVNLYSSDANGTLNIATYNNVGGKIIGTFGGGFNLSGSDIYTVTNGNFNVSRIGNK